MNSSNSIRQAIALLIKAAAEADDDVIDGISNAQYFANIGAYPAHGKKIMDAQWAKMDALNAEIFAAGGGISKSWDSHHQFWEQCERDQIVVNGKPFRMGDYSSLGREAINDVIVLLWNSPKGIALRNHPDFKRQADAMGEPQLE